MMKKYALNEKERDTYMKPVEELEHNDLFASKLKIIKTDDSASKKIEDLDIWTSKTDKLLVKLYLSGKSMVEIKHAM